ncbi:MAG: NAD(P)-dependent oxidoreductase [Mesorhizobium sp.]
MRIAVTGAGGFVGLNIVERLTADGHEVLAIDRAFSQRSAAVISPVAKMAQADVLDADAIKAALTDFRPDALFHGATLTANLTREKSSFADIIDVNVVGTARVLEAAHGCGVRRVVVASSSAVYGQALFMAPPAETDPAVPVTLYGITKLAAEQAALRFADINGLDVRVARIAAVFGAYEHRSGARDVMSPLFQLGEKALAGEAAHLPKGGAREWIAAPRVASIVASLLTAPQPAHRIYNVAASRTWAPPLLARALEAGFPGWRWSHEGVPNVDYADDLTRTRSALDTSRLRREFGDAVVGDPDADAADYVRWLRGHGDWFH